MPRFRTLTGRFGALYAAVIGIAAGVCVVLWFQLARIHTDSDRVMEETREQGVIVRALSGIDTVQALLASPEGLAAEESARARGLLRASVEELRGLDDHPEDPSRPEHQDAEARLSERLHDDLALVAGLLDGEPGPHELDPALALLASAEHAAEVLRAEAQEEAQEANLDLERRTKSVRVVMLATLLVASLLLGLALTWVHVGVVRPLHVLRSAAERFGRGELAHRVHLRNDDELGDLARSLSRMADDLADARDHLEERVRARTREFLRAARLADLGILASGIAHEINTPLASIASCAEGLERRRREGDLSPELLAEYGETIRSEVYRARGITTRMLALVRQQPSTPAPVSLELILEQAASAAAIRARQRGVELARHGPERDVELQVNAGELVQIVVNLLANAIDASPAGAEVTLRTRFDGPRMVLTVEDRGGGVVDDDRERIFEPFYTTKPPGEGTGLGLALVSSMVQSHRGHVSVEARPGGGSVFRVELPTDWRPAS